uniref:Retrotransposon gag domain-containing protein n=1 Tax=Arundo donax TaxID=35708 RepID=A0A0A9DKK6_ARUDO
MPPKTRGHARASAPERGDAHSAAESSLPEGARQVDLLAAMKAMQEELRALRQGQGQVDHASGSVEAPDTEAAGPVSGVSLREWVGMKLDSFDGSGGPIQTADWLAYVVKQLGAFEVELQKRVRYVTQLLKGEAQIWWDRAVAARSAALGSPWDEFFRQFERRFYPTAFLNKMHIDLGQYTQDRKTVAEYEVGFNQIVRFVPHVAHDEREKVRRFFQGLRPAIRHTLGTFPITDFRSMVEQALGVELQMSYTEDLRKTSIGDQSRGLVEKKVHSSGPMQKKGKSFHHQPYRDVFGPSRAPGGSAPQYRVVAKPGMGMVCFPCGDPHHRNECT